MRNQQFNRLKFGVNSIGKYDVDFYCEELKLIIEVDGSIYNNLGQTKYDHERNEFLRSLGYRIYRVGNNSVVNHLDIVLADLRPFTEGEDN